MESIFIKKGKVRVTYAYCIRMFVERFIVLEVTDYDQSTKCRSTALRDLFSACS